jgi:glutathione S-transferase
VARSAEYFHETRSKRFGMPLDELEKSDKGGETAWANLSEQLAEVAKLLKKESGPFFLSSGVSYADFVIAGFWRFLERASKEVCDRALNLDQSFVEHYKACTPWLEKDD